MFRRQNKEIIGEVGCETLEEIREAEEVKRKQHSPMTEAQGERIIELLEKLTSPRDTQLDTAKAVDKGQGSAGRRARLGVK